MNYTHKVRNLPAINRVMPLSDHRLELWFTTGSSLVLDMSNYLNTLRYSPLMDTEVFQSVTTDGNTLLFGEVDTPESLRKSIPGQEKIVAVEISVWEALRLAINCSVWEDWEGEQ